MSVNLTPGSDPLFKLFETVVIIILLSIILPNIFYIGAVLLTDRGVVISQPPGLFNAGVPDGRGRKVKKAVISNR